MRVLNENDIKSIYMHSVDILEKVGVIFDTEKSREIFRSNGAKIDGNKVYITQKLLEDALKLLPEPDNAPDAPKHLTAISPFGNVPFLYDEELGKHRRVTMDDTLKMYKLTQTSELYVCANPATVDPIDVDGDDKYLAQIATLLRYTDKWVSIGMRPTAPTVKDGNLYLSAKNGVQLIKRLYDKWDEPIMSQNFCPMSPLRYDSECLESMTAVAEEGQVIFICPCSLTGMTGPASLYEQLIHDFAISLAGFVYLKLLNPETIVEFGPSSGTTDVRSLQPAYGNPESIFQSVAFTEVCSYYKLGSGITGNMADSAYADYQAGAETCLTTLLPFVISDFNEISCFPGHMAAWQCGSFEKVIYDEDLIRTVNRAFEGMYKGVSPDFLETLESAQSLNTFLHEWDSEVYKRDHYLPQIFSKYGTTQDVSPEDGDIRVKAKNEIDRRMEMYKEPDLTEAQRKILQPYLPTMCKYR